MSEETEQKERTIWDELAEIPGSPDKATVDQWKSKFGDVFVSAFSDVEVYLFRPINRREYKAIQIKQQQQAIVNQQKMQAAGGKQDEVNKVIEERISNDMSGEEETVVTCLLWPKLTVEELQAKAGTATTLLEQIMQNSNFASPQQAAAMVFKL